VPIRADPLLLALATAALLVGCVGDGHQTEARNEPEATTPAPVQPDIQVAGVQFTDVTAAAGITFRHHAGGAVKEFIVEAKGGGGALFDADGDGWLDLYFVDGATLAVDDPGGQDALFLNRRDGTFTDVTDAARIGPEARWGMGAVAGDIDNDGDDDLLVTHLTGAVLLRNEGAPAGRGPPQFAADPRLSLDGWCTGVALADYDLDGDLDLYVARYLDFDVDDIPPRSGMWKGLMVFAGPQGLPAAADALLRNDGTGFTDVSDALGIGAVVPAWGLGVVFGDIDTDGDADIFVANDSAPNHLLRNDGAEGSRRFREIGLPTRVAFSAEGTPQAGMGIAYDDYDADGDRDLFLTHFEDDYNTLYRNDGDNFATVSFDAGLAHAGIPLLGFGTCFLDADNDGDLDLAVGNGHVYPQIRLLGGIGYAQADQLFLNGGEATGFRFAAAAAGDLAVPAVTRGLMSGDWDNDGDVDLVALRLDDRPALLRNDSPAEHHWLTLRLQGRQANRSAVGALVRVVAGDLERTVEITAGGSYLSSGDRRAHFGLGRWPAADRVEIRWPGGETQQLGRVDGDQIMVVRQP
jgi:enediyne biosynthesis protein E4